MRLLVAVVASVLAASSANATVSLAPDVAPPGATVRVSGAGFLPNEVVDVFLDRIDVAVALADPTGAVAVEVQVPTGWGVGTHWTTLLGRDSEAQAQIAIEVGDTSPSAWSQSGAVPEQTGFALDEALLAAANARRLSLAWSSESPTEVGQIEGGPVASATLLYVVRSEPDRPTQNLEALREDGTVAWSQPILGSGARMRIEGWWGTPLALGAGVVVVQTFSADAPQDRVISAFDEMTGAPRWRVTVPCPTCAPIRTQDWLIGWGSPTVTDDVLYIPINAWSPGGVPTGFGQVCALALATGSTVWCRDVDDPTDVAVAGTQLVVGSQDRHRVLTLDAATGTTLWTVDLEQREPWSAITAGPAIVGDLVIVADWEQVYGLRSTDGATAWTWQHEGTKSFVTDGRAIYVADEAVADPWWCEGAINCHPDDARLWALSAETGTPRWRRSFGQQWFSGIIGAGDVVYVQVGDAIVAVRAIDGVVVTTVAGGDWWRGQRGGMLVADGTLFVAGSDALAAYTTATAVPKPLASTLVIDPRLVVPTVAPPVTATAEPGRALMPMLVATTLLVVITVAIALRLRARGRSAPRPPGPRGSRPRNTPGSSATSFGKARRTRAP